jgi:hypothetical protein
MLRNTVAVVLGAVAAGLLISVIQGIGMAVSPLPAGIDFNDPSTIDPGAIPLVNMLWVLASYAVGALVGGAATARIAPGFVPQGPVIVGALFTLASVVNLRIIPHPMWFAVINLLMMIPLAWLGGRLMARKGPAADGGGVA